jgi:hypothetical protein
VAESESASACCFSSTFLHFVGGGGDAQNFVVVIAAVAVAVAVAVSTRSE